MLSLQRFGGVGGAGANLASGGRELAAQEAERKPWGRREGTPSSNSLTSARKCCHSLILVGNATRSHCPVAGRVEEHTFLRKWEAHWQLWPPQLHPP